MSQSEQSLLERITKERPVGSKNNNEIGAYLKQQLIMSGYQVKEFPFECTVWEHGESVLNVNGIRYPVFSSPFSERFEGNRELITVSTEEELEACECRNRILVLGKSIAEEKMQPKNYPFYYPPEHEKLIALLEQKAPAAILAATGKDMLSGLDSVPMFCDGNFLIPSGYMKKEYFKELSSYPQGTATYVKIESIKIKGQSSQIVARKEPVSGQGKGKIVLCAHMDTQYDTDGAIDNAAGVAVLIEAAKNLESTEYAIEIVPMNGEEYYEASGELEYQKDSEEHSEPIVLVINIDSPCHIGAAIGYSLYNFSQQQSEWLKKLTNRHQKVMEGDAWYAGDHAMFAFAGIPCIAVSSSDLFTGALDDTHTKRDVLEHVDVSMISTAADWICEIAAKFGMDERSE